MLPSINLTPFKIISGRGVRPRAELSGEPPWQEGVGREQRHLLVQEHKGGCQKTDDERKDLRNINFSFQSFAIRVILGGKSLQKLYAENFTVYHFE